MKKFLLSFACGLGLAATAQVTSTNISVTLNTPATGYTITPGVQFTVDATITNNGTAALTPADSIICYMALNNNPIRNQNNQLVGRYITEAIPVGGTANFNFNLSFGSIQGFTDPNANFCVVAFHLRATDTDSTNNVGCNAIQVVNGSVSTDDISIALFEDKTTFHNGNLNVNVAGLGFSENITIEVVNIAGQVVATQRVQASQGRVEESIAINHAAGILVYRIIGADGKIHASNKFMAL
ncbi:MAG: hypothetical protein LAT76_04980 [Schleiferiaceae bacterium]|nr:hypothetical protein [Schleiferiaceae bacterium]